MQRFERLKGSLREAPTRQAASVMPRGGRPRTRNSAASSPAATGRAKRKPCARGQSSPCRAASCCSVSTPSAVTGATGLEPATFSFETAAARCTQWVRRFVPLPIPLVGDGRAAGDDFGARGDPQLVELVPPLRPRRRSTPNPCKYSDTRRVIRRRSAWLRNPCPHRLCRDCAASAARGPRLDGLFERALRTLRAPLPSCSA